MLRPVIVSLAIKFMCAVLSINGKQFITYIILVNATRAPLFNMQMQCVPLVSLLFAGIFFDLRDS